jgi:2-keto-3-deoxy-L-rhamnonate aldolase RhmA
MKKDIITGNICIGTWIQTGSTVVSEILANVGYQWVAVDLEHTETCMESFTNILRAISKYDVFPMVRVCGNSTISIRKCLDSGAKGIIVPLINNRDDAIKAVKACKYPPEGVRGFAFVRANEWGDKFDTYAKNANDETVVIVMIETKEAVENINEILSVDGVDGVFIGPYDMSGSYGVPGQTNHKLVVEAKARVLEACKKYNKAAGQHIVLPTKENVANAIEQGYTFLALGMDTVFVANGAKEVLEMAK